MTKIKLVSVLFALALSAGAPVPQFAEDPEDCGLCEQWMNSLSGCPVGDFGFKWEHAFTSNGSSNMYAPHGQVVCGGCQSHEACGSLAAVSHEQLLDALRTGGSLIPGKMHEKYVQVDVALRTMYLLCCDLQVVAAIPLSAAEVDRTIQETRALAAP